MLEIDGSRKSGSGTIIRDVACYSAAEIVAKFPELCHFLLNQDFHIRALLHAPVRMKVNKTANRVSVFRFQCSVRC